MDRYKKVSKTKDNVYETTSFGRLPEPVERDLFIHTKEGDRLDILANRYYHDPSLWWIIALVNENIRSDSMFLEGSLRIKIPYNYSEIIKGVK